MHGWADSLREWPEDVRMGDVFPKYDVAAYRDGDSCDVMRWGMVPKWAKEFDSKYPTHNARIETVSEKPTYRSAWKQNQRCLIPVSGYYEWPVINGKKSKFYITDKDVDGLVVAGLWEEWNEQLSCTMITRSANDYMSEVHHRMLCYLTPESGESWLAGEMTHDELWGRELPNVIYYPAE